MDDNIIKAKTITSNLIKSNKLQLNYIWSNKITQEDVLTPIQLEDPNKNLVLMKNIFLSIVKYSKRLNEIFRKILFEIEKLGKF